MEVLGPKGPVNRFGGVDMLTWARRQLEVARDILDNPGGGLLFATQTIGQVKAGLTEHDGAYEHQVALLEQAESYAVRRELSRARDLVVQVLGQLEQ